MLPCPTCTDQFRTAVVLNPEAEPFTSVKERDGEKQKQENEGTAVALPIQEQIVVDPGIPEDHSELSDDHTSENNEMDTPYLNTYQRRARHRPKILTYESLGPCTMQVRIIMTCWRE